MSAGVLGRAVEGKNRSPVAQRVKPDTATAVSKGIQSLAPKERLKTIYREAARSRAPGYCFTRRHSVGGTGGAGIQVTGAARRSSSKARCGAQENVAV